MALLCDMSPEEIVRSIDFRYITDLVTPEEALSMLQELSQPKHSPTGCPRAGLSRVQHVGRVIGYSDEKIRGLCRDALTQGFTAFKMKVGRNVDDDVRRAALMREEIGPDNALMMDANQIWDVDEAIHWMERLSEFRPLWIEEPTSPDDGSRPRCHRKGGRTHRGRDRRARS